MRFVEPLKKESKKFMESDKPAVLVFGVGSLQKSIIARAKKMGYFVVGIDPLENAYVREDCDAFEVIGGKDFEGTCAVVEKYNVKGIVTTSTDKPLVMMARVAEKYKMPFFSVETAIWSTDKYLMKQRFLKGGIPCAHGKTISIVDDVDDLHFPLIIKPRDNSGSRGVKLCRNKTELLDSMREALDESRMDNVLVEEYIEGKEYSIEALHYNGKSEVIQFTEKETTEFPYNVELGHIQPADISDSNKEKIRQLIERIGKIFNFENCASHTELKINERGIFIIETSPRLGGDFINSYLTPLSTGINMEDSLLQIAMGDEVKMQERNDKCSAIKFFNFPAGREVHSGAEKLHFLDSEDIIKWKFRLKMGDIVEPITSSLNRHGYIILKDKNLIILKKRLNYFIKKIYSICFDH